MFTKVYKNSSVKHILIIALSNIGDVLLSAPSIDILLRDFPEAKVSLVIGERAVSIVEGNPRINKVYIYDKTASFWGQLQWFLKLKQQNFDLVVDFRHTLIGFFLLPTWVTPLSFKIDKIVHLKERHLNRLRTVYDFSVDPAIQSFALPSKEDERHIDRLLEPFMKAGEPFVAIAPIAADKAKTWLPEGFMEVCNAIGRDYGLKIVLLGSKKDDQILENIKSHVKYPIFNLAGHTDLLEAAALLRRAKIAIVHDSGPMHIASYLNIPIVALFGPTDPKSSTPWSQNFQVVHRNSECQRCKQPQLTEPHRCMAAITSSDVMKAFKEVNDAIRS